jgi:hypothetical protein|tara:strand:+ start:2960 stop:3226 length:267 start_codon:yes stop_codon:yes gene_type:complete
VLLLLDTFNAFPLRLELFLLLVPLLLLKLIAFFFIIIIEEEEEEEEKEEDVVVLGVRAVQLDAFIAAVKTMALLFLCSLFLFLFIEGV